MTMTIDVCQLIMRARVTMLTRVMMMRDCDGVMPRRAVSLGWSLVWWT